MGKIEDTIFQNYKKAITQGNLDQANRALSLASEFKKLVEIDGFIDYVNQDQTFFLPISREFSPFLYQYDRLSSTIITANKTIILTPLENKLFLLFDQKTTESGKSNILLTKEEIKLALSYGALSKSSLRIAIFRLRSKLGDSTKDPNIIVNFYNTGYVFTGKRI